MIFKTRKNIVLHDNNFHTFNQEKLQKNCARETKVCLKYLIKQRQNFLGLNMFKLITERPWYSALSDQFVFERLLV